MSREAMKQPEALRLADALDDEFTQGRISNHNGRKAAVELRRLHERCDQWRDIHDAVVADSDKVYALLRQALEALDSDNPDIQLRAATYLRQALVDADDISEKRVDEKAKREHEWVGLTDEEIMEPWPFENRIAFARWLESKIKEKNT